MVRNFCRVILLSSLMCGSVHAADSDRDDTVSATLTVICDDPIAKNIFEDKILNLLRAHKKIQVVDKYGYSNLLVYAQKTINSKVSQVGYVIAVAHTGSYELRLAYQNLRGIEDEKVRAVRSVSEKALRQDLGVMTHLNVMHLDELTDDQLSVVAKVIVDDFVARQ